MPSKTASKPWWIICISSKRYRSDWTPMCLCHLAGMWIALGTQGYSYSIGLFPTIDHWLINNTLRNHTQYNGAFNIWLHMQTAKKQVCVIINTIITLPLTFASVSLLINPNKKQHLTHIIARRLHSPYESILKSCSLLYCWSGIATGTHIMYPVWMAELLWPLGNRVNYLQHNLLLQPYVIRL